VRRQHSDCRTAIGNPADDVVLNGMLSFVVGVFARCRQDSATNFRDAGATALAPFFVQLGAMIPNVFPVIVLPSGRPGRSLHLRPTVA
jgi:hypothetical protein